jgi:uncharacterized membrane protein
MEHQKFLAGMNQATRTVAFIITDGVLTSTSVMLSFTALYPQMQVCNLADLQRTVGIFLLTGMIR